MRAETFKSVLWGAASRGGMDPTEDLPDNIARALVEYINSRARESWESYDWPELVRIEHRAFRQVYSAQSIYAAGDEVFDGEGLGYYRSLQDMNINQALSDTGSWERLTTINRYVAWDQAGETPIGEPLEATQQDPKTFGPRSKQLGFWLSPDGVQFGPDAPETVYLMFRLRPPKWTWNHYSATTNYTTGQTVYHAASGDCYTALQSAANNDPATQSDYWEKIEFPYVLAEHAKLAAAADMLADEQQFDKSASREKQASNALERETDKISRQSGQQRRYRATTR